MPFDGLEPPLNDLAKFDRVIDLIESPGRWTKRTYRNPRGQYCLREALDIVGITERFEPIILKVAAKAAEREFCCVESFNDSPDTAHGDVVFVLRRVREELAAGRFASRVPPIPAPARRARDGHAKAAGPCLFGFWQRIFG
jgi:hypothetical protein